MQLGKVIGGGLPVGAYGGRRDIMQMVAPAGRLLFLFAGCRMSATQPACVKIFLRLCPWERRSAFLTCLATEGFSDCMTL